MPLNCNSYGITLSNASSYISITKSCSWMSIILAPPTTIVNIVLIIALAASTEQTKICTTLLLNLAVTDVLTGVVNLPVNFVIFDYVSDSKDPCLLAEVSLPFGLCLGGTSLLTVTLIAIERFISIFYPFYHQSSLSKTKIIVAVVMSWIMPIVMLIIAALSSQNTFMSGCIAVFIILVVIVNLFCYLKILLKARKVRMQVQREEERFGDRKRSIFHGEKRFVIVGGAILISMLVLSAPMGVANLTRVLGYNNVILHHIRCVGWVLVNTNSLVNPLITTLFVPSIRSKCGKIVTCKKMRQPSS